jgi:hypothetical protein
MAWLAGGACKPSMKKHKDMLKPNDREAVDLELLSLERRQVGRKWLVDHGLISLLAKERRPRLGEPDEPEGIA